MLQNYYSQSNKMFIIQLKFVCLFSEVLAPLLQMVELFYPKVEFHLGGGLTIKVELIPPHGGKATFPTF